MHLQSDGGTTTGASGNSKVDAGADSEAAGTPGVQAGPPASLKSFLKIANAGKYRKKLRDEGIKSLDDLSRLSEDAVAALCDQIGMATKAKRRLLKRHTIDFGALTTHTTLHHDRAPKLQAAPADSSAVDTAIDTDTQTHDGTDR